MSDKAMISDAMSSSPHLLPLSPTSNVIHIPSDSQPDKASSSSSSGKPPYDYHHAYPHPPHHPYETYSRQYYPHQQSPRRHKKRPMDYGMYRTASATSSTASDYDKKKPYVNPVAVSHESGTHRRTGSGSSTASSLSVGGLSMSSYETSPKRRRNRFDYDDDESVSKHHHHHRRVSSGASGGSTRMFVNLSTSPIVGVEGVTPVSSNRGRYFDKGHVRSSHSVLTPTPNDLTDEQLNRHLRGQSFTPLPVHDTTSSPTFNPALSNIAPQLSWSMTGDTPPLGEIGEWDDESRKSDKTFDWEDKKDDRTSASASAAGLQSPGRPADGKQSPPLLPLFFDDGFQRRREHELRKPVGVRREHYYESRDDRNVRRGFGVGPASPHGHGGGGPGGMSGPAGGQMPYYPPPPQHQPQHQGGGPGFCRPGYVMAPPDRVRNLRGPHPDHGYSRHRQGPPGHPQGPPPPPHYSSQPYPPFPPHTLPPSPMSQPPRRYYHPHQHQHHPQHQHQHPHHPPPPPPSHMPSLQLSKRKCVPLKPPIPSKFQGDINKMKDCPVPEFTSLVNFPLHMAAKQQSPDGMRHCVMCGTPCPCSTTKKKAVLTPKQHYAIIPTQNKGLCTMCDVNVWVVVQSRLEIKWCKGCKNFRPWAAFGDKGLATKCVRCRERQREKYAMQKEEKEREKGKKEKKKSAVPSGNNSATAGASE